MQTTGHTCADRLSYRLTIETYEPRLFEPDLLISPEMPCAYDPTGQRINIGDWHQSGPCEHDESIPEQAWLAHYFSMAFNEFVHEMLEFFQVDTRPYLNPHGPLEEDIHAAVKTCAAALFTLTRHPAAVPTNTPPAGPTPDHATSTPLPPWARAVARVDYRLAMNARPPTPFQTWMLDPSTSMTSGECAPADTPEPRASDRQPGLHLDTAQDLHGPSLLDRYFQAALVAGARVVLDHFRVDGTPVVDTQGAYRMAILRELHNLAETLLSLRR
ncbi:MULTISPECIES: hypothetical protein [unclassified Crossiella]|uniref:hypothetical protein n=1 Tax=unclassified Crossiella TaxID=2620835 RepID=UPI001FFFA469|nr:MULTISPECIES: hypothetical protein [unclassified Crossiella]MCK2240053.1 hypothetical protein [Crossiella sp. S99.2]MCK2252761.1 hypothetical protein [Crossiella sp. S99.1]